MKDRSWRGREGRKEGRKGGKGREGEREEREGGKNEKMKEGR